MAYLKSAKTKGCVAIALLFFVSIFCGPAVTAVANPKYNSAQLVITDFSVVKSSAAKHIVTITGSMTNSSEQELKNVVIQLATNGPITSRDELADVRSEPTGIRGFAQPEIRDSIKIIAPGETAKWKLRFSGEKILGLNAQGVFEFGVSAATTANVFRASITAPWTYGTKLSAKTRVALVIPVTALTDKSPYESKKTKPSDVKKLSRLNGLTATNEYQKISWIVDPALPHWAASFAESSLSSESAILIKRLNKIAKFSNLSPYAHANLAGLVGSHRRNEVAQIVKYGSQQWPVGSSIYKNSDGTLTNQTATVLGANAVTPLVSNTFVHADDNFTTDARVRIFQQKSLVFDASASACLGNVAGTKSALSQRMCLASELAMMSFESADTARSVIVLAPAQWKIGDKDLSVLVNTIANSNWAKLVSINSLLDSQFTQDVYPVGTATTEKVSPRNIRQATLLAKSSEISNSIISNTAWVRNTRFARFVGYSDLWPTNKDAFSFLHSQLKANRTIINSITIQASDRITIAADQAQIPITVVNSSNHAVQVRVRVTPDQPIRLQATQLASQLVPVGARVTFAIPITLSGTGTIGVISALETPDGVTFGKQKRIEISSTAYRQVAGILVKLAFGLLLILALSNFVKRRKLAKNPESTN